jgi:hypothetical protein
MARKKIAKEPEKAQRLSLAELAAHDDVCSDAMVDNVGGLNLKEGTFSLTFPGLLQVQDTEESHQTHSHSRHQGRRDPSDSLAQGHCRERCPRC